MSTAGTTSRRDDLHGRRCLAVSIGVVGSFIISSLLALKSLPLPLPVRSWSIIFPLQAAACFGPLENSLLRRCGPRAYEQTEVVQRVFWLELDLATALRPLVNLTPTSDDLTPHWNAGSARASRRKRTIFGVDTLFLEQTLKAGAVAGLQLDVIDLEQAGAAAGILTGLLLVIVIGVGAHDAPLEAQPFLAVYRFGYSFCGVEERASERSPREHCARSAELDDTWWRYTLYHIDCRHTPNGEEMGMTYSLMKGKTYCRRYTRHH